MSLTKLIDDLSENSNGLQLAMLSGNAEIIEDAVATFRDAIAELKAVGQWPDDPAVREKLIALMPQLDEYRALACLLADMTGQAHDMVAARARDVSHKLYGRVGDRFA